MYNNRGDRGRGNRGDRGRGNYGDRGRGRGGGNFTQRGRGDASKSQVGTTRGDGTGYAQGQKAQGLRPGQYDTSDIYEPKYTVDPSDANCMKLEDTKVGNKTKPANLSLANLSLGERLPLRPSYGTQGVTQTQLLTNFYHVNVNSGASLWLYSVQAVEVEGQGKNPKATGKKVTAKILRQLLIQLLKSMAPKMVETDYSGYIVASEPLKLNEGQNSRNIDLQLQFADETKSSAKAPWYRLTVQTAGSVSLGDFMSYLRSPQAGAYFPNKEVTIQMINIVLNGYVNRQANVVAIRQKKFFDHKLRLDALNLTSGLEAMRGFFSSARSSTGRLLLNLQVTTGAFFKAGDLTDLMLLYRDGNPGTWERKISSFLRGVRVKLTYSQKMPGQPTTVVKSIKGLCKRPFAADANTAKFEWTEDNNTKNVTVVQFFKQKYNLNVTKDKFPVIDLGTDGHPVLVPPEFCMVLPGQPCNRTLTPDQTRLILTVGCRKPRLNAHQIDTFGVPQFGLSSGNGQEQRSKPFGLEVVPQMVKVHARILKAPTLLYKDTRGQAFDLPAKFGSWNLRDKFFSDPVNLAGKKWAYFNLVNDNRNKGGEYFRAMQQFVDYVAKSGVKGLGFQYEGNQLFNPELPIGGQRNDRRLSELLSQAIGEAKARSCRLLFFILPSADAQLYGLIKYLCDVKHGIHSICLVKDKLLKGLQSADYSINVAHKLNLKFGGTNQKVKQVLQSLMILKGRRTMFLGIDVTHPAPDSQKGTPSIAGVVGSINSDFTLWPASVRVHEGRVEMVPEDNLVEMVQERLRAFQKLNKQFPSQIIVYRDGVSEGQYAQVLGIELPCIQKAVRSLTKEVVKIAIIICGKRHHTRFYPQDKKNMDVRSGNCPAGTVVDRGVTMEQGWDFFLQAHAAGIGTARPAHYIVVHDDIKMGTHELETMTNTLCYLFPRATKAVSLCPPAYLADLVCERGRCYLAEVMNASDAASSVSGQSVNWRNLGWRRDVHADLQDSMFYL